MKERTLEEDPNVGRRIGGRFELLRPLGGGGAGVVYEARQLDLGRHVALKLLRRELADDHEAVERFRREARAAGALGHPHIAQVLEFAEAQGGEPAYIAFELVRGVPLHALLEKEGRLDPERSIKIASQILAGLEAAHGDGIVHRDLKPANVFLADVPGVGETAKILDFGIAQVHEGEAFRRLTATGVVVGTPRYMSPEQITGGEVDPRSDVWAVGVLLYRMLAGVVPFDGRTGELLGSIRSKPTPPMPIDAQVPAAVEAVVARALEKDRAKRWPSARAMANALEGALAAGLLGRTRRMPRPLTPSEEAAREVVASQEGPRPSLTTTTSAGLPRPLSRSLLPLAAVLAVIVLAALAVWWIAT